MSAIHLQVALLGILYRMIVRHHGREEGFTSGTCIGYSTESVHQIGIVEEYFVWFAQRFESFVAGMELSDEGYTFKEG